MKLTGSRLEEEVIVAEIEEGQGDRRIWLPTSTDFLFLWQTTEIAQKDKGTLRPASGRFRRKRTKYPSRIKWRRCQILTLMSDPRFQFDLLFLCFTDVTRVSEGHGYSSYQDEFPLKDSFKLLDSI